VTIAIFDDVFPWSGSGFRYVEFNFYLKYSQNFEVFSMLNSHGIMDENNNRVSVRANSPYKNRIHFVNGPQDIPKMDGYYCLFLNNLEIVVQLAERDQVPFAFTLYPGGGFEYSSDSSLEKLRNILSHPLFHKVIATQPITLEILRVLDCPPEKIEYIFGVVTDPGQQLKFFDRCKSPKKVCKIVFAAHKYDELGLDKGLDLFVQMADEYISRNSNIEFHIVGPWETAIQSISIHPKSYRTHEIIPIDKLGNFFSEMDIAIFPTRSNINLEGRFDGFPTATMVQAALSGCITVTTNPLKQRTPLVRNKDYIEIEPTLESLSITIDDLLNRMFYLKFSGKLRSRRFLRIFGIQAQMGPRLAVLKSLSN
jgi:glycosyltransferase involved in cell wall biosynthesis